MKIHNGKKDDKLERYDSGTGQLVWTHPKSACIGTHCVIHHPSDHAMKNFPTLWRGDRGIMERICPHGIGHPDPDSIAFIRTVYGDAVANIESIHGCDGCCEEKK